MADGCRRQAADSCRRQAASKQPCAMSCVTDLGRRHNRLPEVLCEGLSILPARLQL